MIVSHRHRFIFIHSPKTAGSSVKLSLMRFLGPTDEFCGGVREAYELGILPTKNYIRNIIGVRSCYVFARSFLDTHKFSQSISNAGKAYYSRHGMKAHSGWKDIQSYLGKEIWDEYYKFTFERNPWDKVVSLYFWSGRNSNTDVSFEYFVEAYSHGINAFTGYPFPFFTGWNLYADGSCLKVNHVGKYENLINDMRDISQNCEIDFDNWLPFLKSSVRTQRDYRQFYSQRLKKLVHKLHQKEIEFMDYTF